MQPKKAELTEKERRLLVPRGLAGGGGEGWRITGEMLLKGNRWASGGEKRSGALTHGLVLGGKDTGDTGLYTSKVLRD